MNTDIPTGDEMHEVIQQLEGELAAARVLLQECLAITPCGYIPNHTIENLPQAISDLTKLLAETTNDLEAAQEKLAYVDSMGLKFGMMETTDRPEPYLTHVWVKGCTQDRIFKEWSDSIGWESQLEKIKKELQLMTENYHVAQSQVDNADINLEQMRLSYKKRIEDAERQRDALANAAQKLLNEQHTGCQDYSEEEVTSWKDAVKNLYYQE